MENPAITACQNAIDSLTEQLERTRQDRDRHKQRMILAQLNIESIEAERDEWLVAKTALHEHFGEDS